MRGKFEEIIGKKFNRLTVLDFEYVKNWESYYRCLCECGNTEIIRIQSVVSGRTKSCGCLKKENRINNCKKSLGHAYRGFNDVSGTYFGNIKYGAKQRDIDFNIQIEDIWEKYLLQNKICALSGTDIKFNKSLSKINSTQTASVDRIKSENGYVKNNIQIIHKDIQNIKWNLPETTLYKFVELVCYPDISLADNRSIVFHNRISTYRGYGDISLSVYSKICKRAKKINRGFNLSIEFLWELFIKQQRRCAITWQPIWFETNSRTRDGNVSLDRIDSTLGYTMDNVQWVHKTVNNMKHDFSMEQFKNYCNLIYNFRIKNR